MTFTAPQNLHTPRLVVRLVSRDDLPALMRMNGDERVTRFLPYATWALPADGEAWFDRMDAAHATGTSLQFVIVERATSVAVGTSLLFRYEAGSARAELGYALGRDCWGRGYMDEALVALIGHAFGPMGLRRLEAEVNPDNRASTRLLDALGFVNEGLRRLRWTAKGATYDVFAYGLLKGELIPSIARDQPA